MVTDFPPIRLKRNRGSWERRPAEGVERADEEKKKEKERGEKGKLEGDEEEKEGRGSLATFRFALIKATWSSPQPRLQSPLVTQRQQVDS